MLKLLLIKFNIHLFNQKLCDILNIRTSVIIISDLSLEVQGV